MTRPPPRSTLLPSTTLYRSCRFSVADKPGVDRFDRQRWRHWLPRRALPGSSLLELRANRRAYRNDLQRHWLDRFHLLFLSRARHRRREESQRLLPHRKSLHCSCAGHHTTPTTTTPDRQRGHGHAYPALLDRLHPRRTRHTLLR